MTPADAPLHVQQDLDALNDVLEQEFEALRQRQMDRLEALDASKTEILGRLQTHSDSFVRASELSGQWRQWRDELLHCKDKHFRNMQLVRRQIDAVQGALQTLMGTTDIAPTVYNRLGQVQHGSGVRAYSAF